MNIQRFRGDTRRLRVYLDDGSFNAVDLTGMTCRLTVNTLEDPPDDTTQKFTSVGSLVSGKPGFVDFPIPGDTDPGEYWFDIQLTDGSNNNITVDKGEYIIVQDISKVVP